MSRDGSDWDYINEHMGGHDEGGLPNFMSEPGFGDDSYKFKDSVYFETFQEAMTWAKSNPGKTITRSPDKGGFVVKNQLTNTSKRIDKNKPALGRFISRALNDWYTSSKAINWFKLNQELDSFTKDELMTLSKEVKELYNKRALSSNTLRSIRKDNSGSDQACIEMIDVLTSISKKLNIDLTSGANLNSRNGWWPSIGD
jgi:hypothetical protein